MAESPVTVDRFSWPDLVPCLVIFRALPTALSMTVLVMSLFAVAVTPIGWIVMEKLFVSSELAEDTEFKIAAEVNRSPWKAVHPNWNEGQSLVTVLGNQMRGVELIFNTAIHSVSGVFSPKPGIGRFIYFFGGALWTLLVWSFFGCAITRAALMKYTREEPIGINDAFNYAINKFFSCFGGIAIPLLAVFGLTIPVAFTGLLMATNFGAAIGGLLWFFVLILSLAIAVIILGLMFAWPLIVSSISCEGQDSFDGMSRAFAYVFQRPVHYFLYTLVAVIFSGVCWLVASNLIEGTIQTANWASSWGMNVAQESRSAELSGDDEIPFEYTAPHVASARDVVETSNQTPDETGESGLLAFGKRMIKFWNNVARSVGAAFLYGLFWSMAAAMYLLLRKDLDATEMDEIHLVDERRTYELPPLKDDESGVPQVDEDADLPARVEPPDASKGQSEEE